MKYPTESQAYQHYKRTFVLRNSDCPTLAFNSAKLLTPEVSHAQNGVFLALQYRFSYSSLWNEIGCLIATNSGYRLTGLPFFIGVPVANITPRQARCWHKVSALLVLIEVIVCIAWASSATTTKLEKHLRMSDTTGIFAHDTVIKERFEESICLQLFADLAGVTKSFKLTDENPTISPSRFQFSMRVQGAITTSAQGL